ncbi:MAG: hypothetical protein EAZ65_07005 [Verrucomicrobia bacterium]|nr:MAG: hypothetical protein EAZ84_07325 [Verrucomicrobiota bacterium]TAE87355.1 MAG: hypothetical protein EAZ82_07985 [Verrucomicrobiota bacterium]TAF25210.1 MAG: hypothetical protein EAZ71_08210 [Verrucomicrobiota bacterium]TAF40856.1 MAG: hypothetical protein EAZ65_07005 [Verrucomicrobiota bacterium]
MNHTSATRAHQSAFGWRRLHDLVPGVFTALIALLLAFMSFSCEGPENFSPIPAEAYSARPSGRLAAGDVIRVSYPGAPELNTTQKIQANGKISLPTIGDVTAEGSSVASLQSQLTGRYQTHLQNPTVLVAVETAASGVYVSGEVIRPGKVPLDRPLTAFDAIMESGGFTKFANPREVVIIRTEGSKVERYGLNLADTISGVSGNAFYLRPYDTVYVKQSRW